MRNEWGKSRKSEERTRVFIDVLFLPSFCFLIKPSCGLTRSANCFRTFHCTYVLDEEMHFIKAD